jgi:hypothetical protein
MPKPPTYFDRMNLRDELRGVESIEERRAVVSKHVLANTRNFHLNNAGFDFDYGTARVRELWAGVEETAREVERGETTEAHLSGAISAWQVTVCEEYLERGRAEREAQSRAAARAPAERPHEVERKEVAAGEDANDDGARETPTPKRRAASRPAKTPPAPPAPGPQGSLFG